MKKNKCITLLCLLIASSLHAEDSLKIKLRLSPLMEIPSSNQDSKYIPYNYDGEIYPDFYNIKKVEPEIVVPKDDYPFEEIIKIRNDKEVLTTSIDEKDIARIKKKFSNAESNENINKIFTANLYRFLNTRDAHCETNYINQLLADLKESEIKISQDEVSDIFKMLRVNNYIDDIYYDILISLAKDKFSYDKIKLKDKASKNPFSDYEKRSLNYNLNELFASFKEYPNEVDSCSYNEFAKVRDNIGTLKDKKTTKDKDLKILSYLALDKKIITLETYNKIKFLVDDSTIAERNIWLSDYLKIVFSAKNKMIPVKNKYKVLNLEDESVYTTERVKRFSRLTRRKILFQKYDENQIIQLAQIMKKASQRMGVDPDTKTGIPYLLQEFHIDSGEGNVETIVDKIELDTQSQFNLARRLLRKDMVTLQMTKSFQQLQITYQDLVTASLETGYLSLDDIDYVVKYDDLWNPEVSKYDRIMRTTFTIAGYGTFLLPPPWNVTGALALSIVEGIANSKNIDGASNDNPNTFIE